VGVPKDKTVEQVTAIAQAMAAHAGPCFPGGKGYRAQPAFSDAALRPFGLVRIVDFGNGRGSDYGAGDLTARSRMSVGRRARSSCSGSGRGAFAGSQKLSTGVGPAPGVVQVSDGNRPGWHPVPNGGRGGWSQYPVGVTRANGMADGFRGNGGRAVLRAAGVPSGAGRPYLSGFGVRAAQPLMIRSRIGEARPGAG
jgi:hypothetical protein